jgi:hypothetical protein
MKSTRPSSTALRKRTFDRDKGICAWCGAKGGEWEADHIIPIVEGGHPTHRDNIRTLCKGCHKRATKDLARRRTGRFTGHHDNHRKRLEAEGLTTQLQREANRGCRLISNAAQPETDSTRDFPGHEPMKLNEAFPSNWLKAADIPEDAPIVVTIKSAEIEQIKGDNGNESKLVLKFRETDKGLICNKTNAVMIAKHFGDDTDDWIGKRVTLMNVEVQFGGDMVSAIRVSKKLPAPKAKAAQPVTVPDEEAELDEDGKPPIPF